MTYLIHAHSAIAHDVITADASLPAADMTAVWALAAAGVLLVALAIGSVVYRRWFANRMPGDRAN
ncbi:hypothetical protein [Glaciihabitans sp. dw_435]|uniref:hypothetical protein n=1 Tax=Glaciihabitans sp. dw_435 TaxID=2720081 RepID=UPI001BD5B20A|nr:hypothetical protein [Glaciihabitans sp. dw_435]